MIPLGIQKSVRWLEYRMADMQRISNVTHAVSFLF